MKLATVLQVGNNLGCAFPMSFVRAMGWLRGDKLMVFESGGDIVIRNDTRRIARFHHERSDTRDHNAGLVTR